MPDARFEKPGDIRPDMPDADRLMMEHPQCWPTPMGFGIGVLTRNEDGSTDVDVIQPAAADNGVPSAQGKLLSLRREGETGKGSRGLGVLLAPELGEKDHLTIVQTVILDERLHELVSGERTFESLLDDARDFFEPDRELGVWVYPDAAEAVAAGWRVD